MKRLEDKETPQCRGCANSHCSVELRGNKPNYEVQKMPPFLTDWHTLHEILQVIADIIAILKGLQR
jgi:hypothetical protein